MWDSCSNTVMCYVPKWVAVDLDGPAGEQPVCSLIWTLLDGKLHCVTSPLQMQFALGTSSAEYDACPVALQHIEFCWSVVEPSYPYQDSSAMMVLYRRLVSYNIRVT